MGHRLRVKVIVVGSLALLLVTAYNAEAQAFNGRMRRPESMPQPPAQPSAPVPPPASPTVAPVQQTNAPSAALPPSMLQQPAQPAKIQFTASTLSIHADNSSLGEILRQFSTQSGMNVQGLGIDERVFGTFGPGNPRDVLADLLNGTPYNVVMVGDQTNGAPRQLILSPANSTAPNPASVPPQAQAQPMEQSDDSEATDVPPQTIEQIPPQREEVPPNAGAPGAVKTPQQLFQELQQMRQQQQQQQQQQLQQQQDQ